MQFDDYINVDDRYGSAYGDNNCDGILMKSSTVQKY